MGCQQRRNIYMHKLACMDGTQAHTKVPQGSKNAHSCCAAALVADHVLRHVNLDWRQALGWLPPTHLLEHLLHHLVNNFLLCGLKLVRRQLQRVKGQRYNGCWAHSQLTQVHH